METSGWLGGQFTSQGVTREDDNPWIETASSTAFYREFRNNIRAWYREHQTLSQAGADQAALGLFNPGGEGGLLEFRFAPRVGHIVLERMLEDAGVDIRLHTIVSSIDAPDGTILSLTATDNKAGSQADFFGTLFLDATDTGDLLPLVPAAFRIGAECRSDFNEPAAPSEPHPDWIQPITVPIALERMPGGAGQTIDKPSDYEVLRDEQQFRITDGDISTMFAGGGDTMWNYRQFIAARNFADAALPHDLTTINTGSNDLQQQSIPTGDPALDAVLIEKAGRVSRAYVYWLQTECPRDDGNGYGYDNLRVRTDIFDMPGGTAPSPYIRESRRIDALTIVRQQDIDKDLNPYSPRAALFRDSCGIGSYGIDIHPLRGKGLPWSSHETQPFQIPLGALVPRDVSNLIAACKNIGTTHITNGAYRVHPVEWNIGESAGALAAFCVWTDKQPKQVVESAPLLRLFQHTLLGYGIPLFWFIDVTAEDDDFFRAAHLMGINGLDAGDGAMRFNADDPFSDEDQKRLDRIVPGIAWPSARISRRHAALWLCQKLDL